MDDLIRREGAIDAIFKTCRRTCSLSHALEKRFEQLPTTQPERKWGKWIEDDDGWDGVIWRCSKCDAVFTFNDGGTPEENEYYFCPHCGERMEGEIK